MPSQQGCPLPTLPGSRGGAGGNRNTERAASPKAQSQSPSGVNAPAMGQAAWEAPEGEMCLLFRGWQQGKIPLSSSSQGKPQAVTLR